MFKVKIRVKDTCTLCGECVKYCPTDVFEIKGKTLVIHEERCIYCGGCIPLCPVNAIELEMLDEGIEVEIHETLAHLNT